MDPFESYDPVKTDECSRCLVISSGTYLILVSCDGRMGTGRKEDDLEDIWGQALWARYLFGSRSTPTTGPYLGFGFQLSLPSDPI